MTLLDPLLLLLALALMASGVVLRHVQVRRRRASLDAHWHTLPECLKGDRRQQP